MRWHLVLIFNRSLEGGRTIAFANRKMSKASFSPRGPATIAILQKFVLKMLWPKKMSLWGCRFILHQPIILFSILHLIPPQELWFLVALTFRNPQKNVSFEPAQMSTWQKIHYILEQNKNLHLITLQTFYMNLPSVGLTAYISHLSKTSNKSCPILQAHRNHYWSRGAVEENSSQHASTK